MARYGDYDPSQMLGLLNMNRFRNTRMPNALDIRRGPESNYSPQKVEMGEELPRGNPMDYMNSHFRANRGEAPPVRPQVGVNYDDMGGFGPDAPINYEGEAPGMGARVGMPSADNTAIQQKYSDDKNNMINQSPFSNMEFRQEGNNSLMDMVNKVPVGEDLPTDLAGSTDYAKGINVQHNIDKIMTPTAEESKFMNLDSNSSPDLRQMAKNINVGDPESVRAFQKAAGLTVDGMFGAKSHAKLREIQGMADDYDKYKNPSLMNYAQNSQANKDTMEKKMADFEANKKAPDWFKGNEWEAELGKRELNENPPPPPQIFHSNF